MGVKSDAWIRRMAREHRMIEPFEPTLVRQNGGPGKAISFGTSSYGYDVRCASEFKIFTNIHSAIVDPKAFDEKSFVDVVGDVCVIPPNSFALARTVEYFRIPRDVLTICLGKSTYARCFRGDTRVALVDGTAPTLEDMARRAGDGEMFWGYSIGEHGRIIVTLLEAPRYIGRDGLLEITLDNGELIHCTPDHELLLRDGRRAKADDLRPGESLMPLYRQLVRGYESVYQPLNGHQLATHRLADEWNVRNGVYADVPGTHRHHRDHDRRNNAPWNLERLPASEHIRHHNDENFGEDFDAEAHGQAIREAFERRLADPQWRASYSATQSERARRFWHEAEYAETRERLRRAHAQTWTPERRAARSEQIRNYFADPARRLAQGLHSRAVWAKDDGERRSRQREHARGLRLRPELTADVVRDALNATGSIRGAARLLNCDRSVFRRFPEVIAQVRGSASYRNHKVASIKTIPGEHDVFCLTVPEAGNFALEAGVFVRNCGIIVNVTPLEPEWEGHVTLEFSNTTTLPAKIYANEGVAQVIFLGADEPCETSYKDRGGKYQGQTGVTLPKA